MQEELGEGESEVREKEGGREEGIPGLEKTKVRQKEWEE